MKYTNRMGESCMGRAGENQIRKSELSDPPQSLERPSLDDLPQRVLELLGVKLDQIMEGVSDALGFCRT